jgi:lipoate---protein ligase
MHRDWCLLCGVEEDEAIILHHHRWSGFSMTYGYFIDPLLILQEEVLKSKVYNLARRPTGGGMMMHKYDTSFSLIFPAGIGLSDNPKESTRQVNILIMSSLQKTLQEIRNNNNPPTLLADTQMDPWAKSVQKKKGSCCLADATTYDILYEGYKVVGSAQRRRKGAIMHQATVVWRIPGKEVLERIFLPNSEYTARILKTTRGILDKGDNLLHYQNRFKRNLEDEVRNWVINYEINRKLPC